MKLSLSPHLSVSRSLSLRSMYQSCSDTWSTLISSLQTCSILATSLLSSPPLLSPLFSLPVLSSFLPCSAHAVSLLSSLLLSLHWCWWWVLSKVRLTMTYEVAVAAHLQALRTANIFTRYNYTLSPACCLLSLYFSYLCYLAHTDVLSGVKPSPCNL